MEPHLYSIKGNKCGSKDCKIDSFYIKNSARQSIVKPCIYMITPFSLTILTVLGSSRFMLMETTFEIFKKI